MIFPIAYFVSFAQKESHKYQEHLEWENEGHEYGHYLSKLKRVEKLSENFIEQNNNNNNNSNSNNNEVGN